MKRNVSVVPSFSSSRASVGGQPLDTESLPAPGMKGAPFRSLVTQFTWRPEAELGWTRQFLAGAVESPHSEHAPAGLAYGKGTLSEGRVRGGVGGFQKLKTAPGRCVALMLL